MEKWSLQDAYRYSGIISTLISDLKSSLMLGKFDGVIISEKQNHKKSLSNPADEDELKTIELKNVFELTSIEDVYELADKLIVEKLKIMAAIEKAKNEMHIDIDGTKVTIDTAISYNSILRDLNSYLIDYTLSKKSMKSETTAYGLMLNEEKNQVEYKYPVDIETEILYNRIDVLKRKNKNLELADNISRQIDEANNKRIIEFDADISFYDSLDTLFVQNS